MASKKKAFEIDKIRAALKFHGCKIKSIKECKPEPPDAIALIMFRRGNTWQRVGIEETEYYSGTEPGQKSSEQALHDFWDLTCTSIARRVGHRPNLTTRHRYVRSDYPKIEELLHRPLAILGRPIVFINVL